MSVIEPTIEEKEKYDESLLLETINTMNQQFKNFYTKKEKDNLNPNLLPSSLDEIDFSINKISEKKKKAFTQMDLNDLQINSGFKMDDVSFSYDPENKLSPTTSKDSTALNTLSNGYNSHGMSPENMENFLNQNLINFNDILKFLVIGDKSVGKTLFINKFINNDFNYMAPTER